MAKETVFNLKHSGIDIKFTPPTKLEIEEMTDNLKLLSGFAMLHHLFSKGLLKETQRAMGYIK